MEIALDVLAIDVVVDLREHREVVSINLFDFLAVVVIFVMNTPRRLIRSEALTFC